MYVVRQSQNPLHVGTHVFGYDGGDTTITADNLNNFVLDAGDIICSDDGTIAKVMQDGSEEIYADGSGLTADTSDDVKTIGSTPNGFKDMWDKLLKAARPEQNTLLNLLLEKIKKHFDPDMSTEIDGTKSPDSGDIAAPGTNGGSGNMPAAMDGSGSGTGGGGSGGGGSGGAGHTTAPANTTPTFNANPTGVQGDDTAATSLKDHVNAILADGRNHGFENGYETFKERVKPAMDRLREKGIVTSKDPYEAMQQASNWLMANSGTDKVFSFGGGPNGEDDAARLEQQSGISRGDINTIKFMFDSHHDAELNKNDAFLNVKKGVRVFDELATLI